MTSTQVIEHLHRQRHGYMEMAHNPNPGFPNFPLGAGRAARRVTTREVRREGRRQSPRSRKRPRLGAAGSRLRPIVMFEAHHNLSSSVPHQPVLPRELFELS